MKGASLLGLNSAPIACLSLLFITVEGSIMVALLCFGKAHLERRVYFGKGISSPYSRPRNCKIPVQDIEAKSPMGPKRHFLIYNLLPSNTYMDGLEEILGVVVRLLLPISTASFVNGKLNANWVAPSSKDLPQSIVLTPSFDRTLARFSVPDSHHTSSTCTRGTPRSSIQTQTQRDRSNILR
jgi:hypothetical protein